MAIYDTLATAAALVALISGEIYSQTLRPQGNGKAPGYFYAWWSKRAVPSTADEAIKRQCEIRWPRRMRVAKW